MATDPVLSRPQLVAFAKHWAKSFPDAAPEFRAIAQALQEDEPPVDDTIPNDGPNMSGDRLLLNAYGRRCYEAGQKSDAALVPRLRELIAFCEEQSRQAVKDAECRADDQRIWLNGGDADWLSATGKMITTPERGRHAESAGKLAAMLRSKAETFLAIARALQDDPELEGILKRLRRDLVDAPAIQMLDGKFYRTVPTERVDELDALLAARVREGA